jgi:hypothetical protein
MRLPETQSVILFLQISVVVGFFFVVRSGQAGEGEFGCGKLKSQVCLAGANAGGALRNAVRCNRSDAGKEGGGKEEERWK